MLRISLSISASYLHIIITYSINVVFETSNEAGSRARTPEKRKPDPLRADAVVNPSEERSISGNPKIDRCYRYFWRRGDCQNNSCGQQTEQRPPFSPTFLGKALGTPRCCLLRCWCGDSSGQPGRLSRTAVLPFKMNNLMTVSSCSFLYCFRSFQELDLPPFHRSLGSICEENPLMVWLRKRFRSIRREMCCSSRSKLSNWKHQTKTWGLHNVISVIPA